MFLHVGPLCHLLSPRFFGAKFPQKTPDLCEFYRIRYETYHTRFYFLEDTHVR